MKRPIDERPEKGWFCQQELADLLGITLTAFDRTHADIVQPTAVKTTARNKKWIRGRAWLDAYVARELRKQLPADADPMLAGSGSPALERYRAARAEREELNLAEHRGELIHSNQLRQQLQTMAGVLREAIAQLQREFGQKAYEIVAEALAEAESKIEAIGRGISDGRPESHDAMGTVERSASTAADSPVDA